MDSKYIEEMNGLYSRDIYLGSQFNSHLSTLTKIKKDYYSKLSHTDLMLLKSVLVDINNILTLKLTMSAVQWLGAFFKLNKTEVAYIMHQVDKTSPNSKGFDIRYEGAVKFVAEVKCIDPVKKGNRFGAAQRNSILQDFIKLKNGKFPVNDTSNYFKFLFLLDLGDRTSEALLSLLKQAQLRVENTMRVERNAIKNHVIILSAKSKMSHLNYDNVYAKVINL